MILEHALFVLFLAAATAGLAIFVRALPWPKSWLAVKPLGCSACTSGWAGFAVLGWAHHAGTLPFALEQLPLLWLALISVAAPAHHYVYPPDIELPMP